MTQDDPDARADQALEEMEERRDRLDSEISHAKEHLVENRGEDVHPDVLEGAIGRDPENTEEPEADGTPKGWA